MFKKMPFILLGVILSAGIMTPWLPVPCRSVLYGVSLSLKSLIVFMLPFLIFGLLFKTAVQIAGKATKTILLILGAVCCSNFFSTFLSYWVGRVAYRMDLPMALPPEGSALQAAWTFSLPKWIGNDQAMFAALLLGIILVRWKPVLAGKLSCWFEAGINKLLKAFLCIIPVFIAGFVVKLSHDEVIALILGKYALIFGLIACAVFSYVGSLYLLINRLQLSGFVQSVKNMLPAAIAGFGSMSSAAAMPLTILGTEKNSQNPDLARAVIPVTVNIHLIGDCFAIPIFAFAVLSSFGVAEPTFLGYLTFASYFVLAKFSVAAVPGGGILVMLPILESHLGFNAEMLSLITALYILFDPVITCANVFGNGAFAMATAGKRITQNA